MQNACARNGARTSKHTRTHAGTTVKPLIGLKGTDIDFSKVHVFFGNERVSGETAYKCHDTAEFLDVCGIPRQQVHKVPWGGGAGGAAGAALEYEELIRSMPPAVVGECARSGLPALDLVLLGSGVYAACRVRAARVSPGRGGAHRQPRVPGHRCGRTLRQPVPALAAGAGQPLLSSRG
ncbi:MAG: 6-phosphogluconolactonase [Promethearchaeia archaeon]